MLSNRTVSIINHAAEREVFTTLLWVAIMLEPLNLKSVSFSFAGENWNFGSLNSVADAGATDQMITQKL